jgi:hypothetical protein
VTGRVNIAAYVDLDSPTLEDDIRAAVRTLQQERMRVAEVEALLRERQGVESRLRRAGEGPEAKHLEIRLEDIDAALTRAGYEPKAPTKRGQVAVGAR